MSELSTLFHKLGYTFEDAALAQRALRHRSAGRDNNERLEFLGDAVLNLVIAEALSDAFPDSPEGDLSRMRANLVKGSTLAQLAREFDLGEFVILGSGELKSGGHRRDSILADCVEALLGAIYTEAGFGRARESALAWYAERLRMIHQVNQHKDAKTRLQEYLQGRGAALPEYTLLGSEGDPHRQTFEVSCSTELSTSPATARASSRKKAEQAAAALMLEQLQVNDD